MCRMDDFQETFRNGCDSARVGVLGSTVGSCSSLRRVWMSFADERCRSQGQAPGASPPACPHWQKHPVSYPRQHLPLKTLKGLFQQQLSVEMATTVTVDSVEKAPLLTNEVLQAVRARLSSGLCSAELGVPWSGHTACCATAPPPRPAAVFLPFR